MPQMICHCTSVSYAAHQVPLISSPLSGELISILSSLYLTFRNLSSHCLHVFAGLPSVALASIFVRSVFLPSSGAQLFCVGRLLDCKPQVTLCAVFYSEPRIKKGSSQYYHIYF